MRSEELLHLSISDLSSMIKSHQISPVEITKAYLNRIEKVDSKVNSYIKVLKEEAFEFAEKAEESIIRGHYKGRLHGIPLAIKDNIDLMNVPTTSGSIIHKDFIPKKNAPAVTQLLDDCMIPIGKTNLHEFAMGVTTENPHFKPTRNPWDLAKVPG